MKRRLAEQTVLFVSVVKWVFLATIAGVVVGGATTFFLKFLSYSIDVGKRYPHFFWLLPVALFTSILLIKYLAPDAEGHGTEKVIEAIHKHSGKISIMVVPVKLLATIITIATGGSAGKEGPCAQIGAGLTSALSDMLRFDDKDRKKLVVCGISAGFAAVFGTPIAGSIFGVEVLFVGTILYDVLLPSIVAGVTAYHVASYLGITYFDTTIINVPALSEVFMFKVMLSGLFFGFCSIFLIEILYAGERISARLKVWLPLKGIIGGVLLICLTYIFSNKYLGLGLETIEAGLRGEVTDWYAFLVKPLFTSVTLFFGGSGGIVTPIFFVGTTAGVFFANIVGLSPTIFAPIGLVSVLAGAANTPIAASIMALELFGPSISSYAVIACIISYLITGHRSVYPSQILSVNKSESLQVNIGARMDNLKTTYSPRKKSLVGKITKFINRNK